MKLGKIMFVSMLLLVILAIGAVSASDTNDTLKATDDDNIRESANGFEDNLKINEENEILKETPKTFTELNETINGNKGSEIYLDSNYTFESGTDDNFKKGVIIDRAVTVYGNGYALNGNNAARIFHVTNSNVTFKNIFFVNGIIDHYDYSSVDYNDNYDYDDNYDYEYNPDYERGDDGGAIKGKCTAINCTFNSNSAGYYGRGGAMSGGSAVNCNFVNNSASYGGAMYRGFAVNCTFVNNSADGNWGYGGAMYYCSPVNCTFNSNFAVNRGGAMYSGRAVNCTFNSNSAGYYWEFIATGGAMSGGSAVNCNFVNNSAPGGGAMSGGSAVNCNFVNNSALDGGAMSGGSAVNCTFVNNSALDVSAVNCTFYPDLIASNVKVVYAAGSYYSIKVYGNDGKLANGATVKISGKISKTLKTTDGIAKFKVTQVPGTYKIKITALGKSLTKTITVKKATPKLTAAKKTFKRTVKVKNYAVTLKTNKNKALKSVWVSLKVNKKTYKVKTNAKGQAIFKINNLVKKGTFNAVVKFAGNKYYNAKTVNTKIFVR